jgi:phage shock protein PspC (stress-responsive transcriptional regulator)
MDKEGHIMEEEKILRRSKSNRMIAGVVAGLAKYFGMDPVVARVIYVLVSICSAGFPGTLVYIILWIVIPEESDEAKGA